VVRQVSDCRTELAVELDRPGVRSLTLGYESLCREPRRVLSDVVEALTPIGFSIEILDGVLGSFTASPGPQLPLELHADLRAALNRAAAKE
jgi:hypothetical protein